MIKTTNKNNEVSYVLTETERVSLASAEAIALVNSRVSNLEMFVDSDLDFFTGKEVKEENKWYFNVNKDGKLYTCIYDNEHEPIDVLEKETRCLLMWRYNGDGGFGYTENVGVYIECGKEYTVDDTLYNDCDDIDRSEGGIYEEVELNENNKEEVREWILSL